MEFVTMGAENYIQWAWTDDRDKINEHKSLAFKVAGDVSEALNLGLIKEQYQNEIDIANIMNVVLQGVNNTDNPEIYEIGMKIFNAISVPFELLNSTNSPGSVVPQLQRQQLSRIQRSKNGTEPSCKQQMLR